LALALPTDCIQRCIISASCFFGVRNALTDWETCPSDQFSVLLYDRYAETNSQTPEVNHNGAEVCHQ